MPADMVSNEILPDLGQELITIMDDYGTENTVQVNVSDSANRQSYIDTAVAQLSANQAALENYATAHNLDLSAKKTAGLAKKEAAIAAAGNGQQ